MLKHQENRVQSLFSPLSRTLAAPLILGLLSISSISSAADPESGKELYHEVEIESTIGGIDYTNANCETCHETSVFTRADRKVTTYAKLEAFVEGCNTNLDVGWFPEDVSDVSAYLNQEHYKFETPK